MIEVNQMSGATTNYQCYITNTTISLVDVFGLFHLEWFKCFAFFSFFFFMANRLCLSMLLHSKGIMMAGLMPSCTLGSQYANRGLADYTGDSDNSRDFSQKCWVCLGVRGIHIDRCIKKCQIWSNIDIFRWPFSIFALSYIFRWPFKYLCIVLYFQMAF